MSALVAIARRAGSVLRRVIGAPDYERYLAHVTQCHSGATPMSRHEFARDALARRYDRPGSRCC
ncbi:MAG: YbdD/YjiX family protein [Gemmatimonadaceae bacterium]